MRVWIYQTLKLSGLWTPIGGRVFQTSRVTKVPDQVPHAFYRVGLATGLIHSDAPVVSTPFQLFLHDTPGDFVRIDELLDLAKTAFTLLPPLYPSPKLIRCEWLEHSEDGPEDPLTGTISKFARYRLVHLA